MSEGKKTFVSKQDLVFDAVFMLVLLAFWSWVAASHVPSNDPAQIRVWGAFTSSCMTAVFWMSWQLLRVVYRRQKETSSGK
jgi:hypothetical protein